MRPSFPVAFPFFKFSITFCFVYCSFLILISQFFNFHYLFYSMGFYFISLTIILFLEYIDSLFLPYFFTDLFEFIISPIQLQTFFTFCASLHYSSLFITYINLFIFLYCFCVRFPSILNSSSSHFSRINRFHGSWYSSLFVQHL